MAMPAELAGKLRRDVAREGRLRTRSRPAGARGVYRPRRPERLADRADALEPGIAREIVGPRQRHRRRRREPGAQRESPRPARCRPATCPRRPRPGPAAAASGSLGAQQSAGPCRVAARCSTDSTSPANSVTTGPLEPRLRRPTRPAPRPARSRAPPQARTSRAPGPPARCRRRSRQARKRRGDAQERRPLPRRAEREPGRDPAAEADDEPRRKLRALRLEEPFQLLVQARKTASSNSSEHAVEEALPLC